jgi:bidirectional [NiFe] hydrogenase diaphorase subunit
MEELCEVVQKTSLCGLGQTAPNPVVSTLRYFRNEYEAKLGEDDVISAQQTTTEK